MLELFEMESFLPLPYEAALAPRLSRAQSRAVPVRMEECAGRLQAAAAAIRTQSQALVTVGLGGAGSRGLADCLLSPYRGPREGGEQTALFFLGGGLSGDSLEALFPFLEYTDFSLLLTASAPEALALFQLLREALERRYGLQEAARRIYIAGEADGPLQALAQAGEAQETFFPLPRGGEGPHGLLTIAGLLPLETAGADTAAILDGAAEMAQLCQAPSYENPAWRYAAARHQLYRSGWSVEVLAAFDPGLRQLLDWWRQLCALGEGKDGKALFPVTALYPGDLYTLGQYLQEGRRLMFETVLRFSPGSGNNALDRLQARAMDAARLAHSRGGVPNLRLDAGEKSARSLGRLVYFLEFASGLSAGLLDVDPLARGGAEAYEAAFSRTPSPAWPAGLTARQKTGTIMAMPR